MLVSLSVKNFAIIDNIQIEFNDNMSVLTGETGAGKSLIIDAIGLLFGNRASSDLIRFGESKATIEGVFSTFSPKIADIIGEELADDEYLVIKREIYNTGKSLCKINNNIISLAQLNKVAETIGDIHSQFDTQGLFNPKNYLEFVDDQEIGIFIEEYQRELAIYQEDQRRYSVLLNKNKDDNQRLEFLKFQLSELDRAELSLKEEEELKERSHILENVDSISSNLQAILDLYQEKNILDDIYQSMSLLTKIANYNQVFGELTKQIEDAYFNLSDALNTIILEFKNLDFDASELESLNNRLGLYSDLRRKYKKSTEEIINFQQELKNEIENIENYDFTLQELEKKANESYHKVLQIAQNIRTKRKANAKNLESKIIENLTDLELKNTQFKVEFNDLDEIRFNQKGIDQIDFMVSFNKGEPLRPLSKIASGGELSRFMLALKALVARKLSLQLIIFDEIDHGVSGAIAYSIANKIKSLSKDSQVLCVTHLPQVAAISENHYQISKKLEQGRTTTEIKLLDESERIIEIAKMISNGEVTNASKNLAIELLKK